MRTANLRRAPDAPQAARLAVLLAALARPAAVPAQPPQPVRDSIPGTLVTWEMVPVPGGTVSLPAPGGTRIIRVEPFWIARTELVWDAYDVFAFRLDEPPERRGAATDADAMARPSRPYGAPDYGFGHQGFPAISVAYTGAEAFCAWLSRKTGHRYRLATDAEWTLAARLATPGRAPSRADLDTLAWHAENSQARAHRAGSKRADALGLFDLFGNAGEWVTGEGGTPILRGGSWADPPDLVGPDARATRTPAWNERDPQIPKSRWWLSDAPFAGFRIVRKP